MSRLIKKLILFAPFFLLVPSINYLVDPAALFSRESFESDLADHLIKGETLELFGNFDDRAMVRALVARMRTPPDMLVIGSSRTMEIGSETIAQSVIANNSVTSACLDDYLAIYQLYRQNNIRPRRILIGVDHWLFNANDRCRSWQSLWREHEEIRKVIVPDTTMGSKFTQWLDLCSACRALFSPAYFQAALLRVWDIITGKITDKRFEVVSSPTDEKYVIKPDGSYNFGGNYYKITANEAKIAARRESVDYRNVRYFNLDNRLMDIFVRFLDLLVLENVEVIILLPPMHPDAFPPGSRFESVVNQAEQFIRKAAQERQIRIVGSYSAAMAGVGYEDFYDGHHIRKSSLHILLPFDPIVDPRSP